MLAIIGGSGLSQLSNLDVASRRIARTPYGEPSSVLTFGRLGKEEAIFLARHGHQHTMPPHRVNYRANLWALRENGATHIVSVASVGGILAGLNPGDLIIPHQILDYTWGRASSFFEEEGTPVTHIDFTEPYDARLRQSLLDAAKMAGIPARDGGVYAATQGPRLETAAEINRLERDGAEIVGMTGMPEAALARELEIPYAMISLVANHAAGRNGSHHGIDFGQLETVLSEAMEKVRAMLARIALPREERNTHQAKGGEP
ncbi:MAG: S-methyl-5'-thioinosine phosphorylase [Zoogloeaceae bacterium]|jgi:5'-methylthioadenosine phosphorylase|nr:S-methyl-5'-thioinosine phosphorylase [Zoogloeaceae bacterium]